MQEILSIEPDQRRGNQRTFLWKFFKGQDAGYAFRNDCVIAAENRLPDLDTTIVLRERKGTPNVTFVFVRGVFTNKGPQVFPNVPAVLPSLKNAPKPNRLDFSRWLVSDENLLTPRVTVNRIWQRYFGLGIVETENNFGKQGKPPTYPQLLD